MSSIIAFVSQTGNVMKTTLTAAVGLTLASAGTPVVAIDLDQEHWKLGSSLAVWLAERSDRHGSRAQLGAIFADTAEQALNWASRQSDKIVLIDCPSRASEATAVIMQQADLVIVPLVPGDKDLTLTQNSLAQLIGAGADPRRIRVILTRTGSKAEARDFRFLMQQADIVGHRIGVLDAVIPEQTAYRNALSRYLAITEASPVSVGQAARAAVDEIINAYLDVTEPLHTPQPKAVA